MGPAIFDDDEPSNSRVPFYQMEYSSYPTAPGMNVAGFPQNIAITNKGPGNPPKFVPNPLQVNVDLGSASAGTTFTIQISYVSSDGENAVLYEGGGTWPGPSSSTPGCGPASSN